MIRIVMAMVLMMGFVTGCQTAAQKKQKSSMSNFYNAFKAADSANKKMESAIKQGEAKQKKDAEATCDKTAPEEAK